MIKMYECVNKYMEADLDITLPNKIDKIRFQ